MYTYITDSVLYNLSRHRYHVLSVLNPRGFNPTESKDLCPLMQCSIQLTCADALMSVCPALSMHCTLSLNTDS